MQNSHHSLHIAVILYFIVALFAAFAGYEYGTLQTNTSVGLPFGVSQNGSVRIGPASIIKKQQAIAVGTVVAADVNTITLKANDNTEQTFALAKTVMVFPLSNDPKKPLVGTSDKKTIVLNQQAVVLIDLIGDKYMVTNVRYVKNISP